MKSSDRPKVLKKTRLYLSPGWLKLFKKSRKTTYRLGLAGHACNRASACANCWRALPLARTGSARQRLVSSEHGVGALAPSPSDSTPFGSELVHVPSKGRPRDPTLHRDDWNRSILLADAGIAGGAYGRPGSTIGKFNFSLMLSHAP